MYSTCTFVHNKLYVFTRQIAKNSSQRILTLPVHDHPQIFRHCWPWLS